VAEIPQEFCGIDKTMAAAWLFLEPIFDRDYGGETEFDGALF
jgi:hypothetical protein